MLPRSCDMLRALSHTPNRQQTARSDAARYCESALRCDLGIHHWPMVFMPPAGTRLPGKMLPGPHMPPRAATWALSTCARSRSLWRSRSSCLSFSLSASATWWRQAWLVRGPL